MDFYTQKVLSGFFMLHFVSYVWLIIPIQRIDENLIIIDIARCLGIFLFKVLLIELCFFLEAFFKESPLKSVSKKHFF